MPDSTILVQEATAEEIWEKAVQVHAVPFPEAIAVVVTETLAVFEVEIFASVLIVF